MRHVARDGHCEMGGSQNVTRMTKLMRFAHRAGIWDVAHKLVPQRLTVLAYHRIADPILESTRSFVPNISATPAGFAEQMDFINSRYTVISVDHLLAWLRNERDLPACPALVTFDDGYRDVYLSALPVLEERDMPFLVFIATDCINSHRPFWWDMVAFAFQNTSLTAGNLPLIGEHNWNGVDSRMNLTRQWVGAAKYLARNEKEQAVAELASTLRVEDPTAAFAEMHLTWDQIKEMAQKKVTFGGHTRSHPILSRISDADAECEILESKTMLEQQLGQPVRTFAYPNGMSGDFHLNHQRILAKGGIEAAFTLSPGPSRYSEAKQSPLTIRRILVTLRDDSARFAAKVTGLSRAVSVV